jgi:hypothetical protein
MTYLPLMAIDPPNTHHASGNRTTKPFSFTLVVDDFGVKYLNKADAEHLKTCLSKHYPMKSDWTGGRYVGIYLDWDYENRTVKLTMPDYVKNTVHQFGPTKPKQLVYAPSKYTAPQYGAKVQLTNAIDTSPKLTQAQTTLIEQITGTFLYYARAINGTMLHALNDMATWIATGNQSTAVSKTHFLHYCTTNPDTELLYRASNMIFKNDSDAAYLVAPGTKSRAGGHTYFGNQAENPKQIINGDI